MLGPPLSVCKLDHFGLKRSALSLEVIKELSRLRHEQKVTDEGDKALSHLMGIPASSSGSIGIPAQLAGAGGTEQTRPKVSWAMGKLSGSKTNCRWSSECWMQPRILPFLRRKEPSK